MPPFYRLYSLPIVYHKRIEGCNQSLLAMVLEVVRMVDFSSNICNTSNDHTSGMPSQEGPISPSPAR